MLVKLELTFDDVNVIIAGLGELPAKISLGVIERVRKQAAEQLRAEEPADNQAVQ
jgi:hypothetical protein